MKSLLLFFMILSAAPLLHASDLVLSLGEEHLLPRGEKRIWIESPSLLKASERQGRIVLKPLKTGRLQIRGTSGPQTVEIVSPASARTYARLQSANRRLVGLKVGVLEGQVTLDGRLHRIADYRQALRDLPPDAEWLLKAKMSEEVREDFLREVQKELSLDHPPALVFGDEIRWLLNSEKALASLPEKKIRRLGIRFVMDPDSVSPEPVVRVEVAVAEVRREAMQNYGLGWPASAEAKLLPEGTWARGELLFKASAFEKAGHGRLLARPTLICRSGKEAEFIAGGEFPIKVFNEHNQGVLWKRYGVLVTVKPQADRAGRISLGISVEVSSIDDASKVDGVPGLRTNRVASHFDLSRPRVIALSGLLKQEDGTSREGLLGLSKLPILGALFSSRDWREHRSELVIFVRPEIVKETF